MISSWVECQDQKGIVYIKNSSTMPVYMVEVYLYSFSPRRFYVGVIQPDSIRQVDTKRNFSTGVQPGELRFIDSAGRHWRRSTTGDLIRLKPPFARRTKPVVYSIRHPIAIAKRITPQRYPRPTGKIDDQARREAISSAAWVGHDAQTVERAINKLVANEPLRLSEKLVLDEIYPYSPGFRKSVAGDSISTSTFLPARPFNAWPYTSRRGGNAPRRSIEDRYKEKVRQALRDSEAQSHKPD
jgi:hypothetical protein